MKKIVSSVLISTMLLTPVTAYASQIELPTVSDSDNQNHSRVSTIDEFINDDFYKDLPKDPEAMAFYKEIEEYKLNNPSLSDSQIVEHFDNLENSKVSLFAFYAETKAQWNSLTTSEKVLVASNPVYAAITQTTRDKAYDFTTAQYGRNGQGDVSDAFRHAMWNALTSKYTSKAWASAIATAHEDKDAAYKRKVFEDGNTGAQHIAMDLHNNQVGRDCWSVLLDYDILVSDNDLKNRVLIKIQEGKVKILNR